MECIDYIKLALDVVSTSAALLGVWFLHRISTPSWKVSKKQASLAISMLRDDEEAIASTFRVVPTDRRRSGVMVLRITGEEVPTSVWWPFLKNLKRELV